MKFLQQKLLKLSLIIALLLTANATIAQSIFSNPITDGNPSAYNPYTIGQSVDGNITVSGIGRGTGITPNAGSGRYNAKGWNTPTLGAANYFEFTLSPNDGYKINFINLVYSGQKSGTGPSFFAFRSSLDGYAENIGTAGISATIDLTSADFQGIAAPVTFRLYAWGAGSAAGTYSVNDFTFNGTVEVNLPDAPIATDATDVVSSGFMANWEAVAGATGYRLDVATDAAFTNILENYDNIAVAGLSHNVSVGILPDTDYYYRVRAEENALVSNNSNIITVNVPGCGTIDLPVVTAQTFCVSGTVGELMAEGENLQWFANATAEAALTADTELETGSYYVSQTINGCVSERAEVEVTITVTPEPEVQPLAYCGSATADELEADGENIQWYADDTTEDVLASDTVLATGTYYASQVINDCESVRVAVEVTINEIPDAPVAENDVQEFCGEVMLANILIEGENISWYTSANGDTSLEEDMAFEGGTTLLFASQMVNGCESTERTPIAVVLNITEAPAAEAQTFCGDAVVEDLSVQGMMTEWYADETGGEALVNDTPLATGTYYVSQTVNGCESPRTAVEITVNEIPDAPEAAAQLFCGSGIIGQLEVTTGENILWYLAENEGNPLDESILLVTGSYYVSQTVNGCESERTEVSVTVNEIPDAPVVTPLTFCGAATAAELTIADIMGAQWYADETTEETLSLDTALATETYYVSQIVNGCESERAAVAVTIHEVPEAPIAEALDFCGMATVENLTVTEGEMVLWYGAVADEEPLAINVELMTGTYYVSQTVNGCESERAAVSVTVNEIPVAPIGNAMQEFNEGDVLADLIVEGENILWFSDEELTEALTQDTDLTDETIYYAVAVNGDCVSEVLAITVNEVLSNPAFNNAKFTFYPNPVKDILTISYQEEVTSVTVYNSLGQAVLVTEPNVQEPKIDMSSLPAGNYIVRLSAGNYTETIKIIKN